MNKTLERKIKNWRQVYPGELAKHFKRNKRKGEQFTRLSSMQLNKEDIESLFHTPTDTQIDFSIMIGLDRVDSPIDKFTFRPIISAWHSKSADAKSDQVDAEFDHVDGIADSVFDEPVPETFKKWLTGNWLSHDVNLLSNAFTASFAINPLAAKPGPIKYENKRLMGYYFNDHTNEEFWEFINTNRAFITEFIFHLGLDMNKSNHSEQFLFSPVFEIHLEKRSDADIVEMNKLGLRTFRPNDEDDSVSYYEYMSPCPPTCNDTTRKEWK